MNRSITFLFLFVFLTIDISSQSYTWEIADPSLQVAARYDDISFVNPMLGWAVNSSGQIQKTTDGGKSWTKQLQTTDYFRSIKFADSLNGWAGTVTSANVLYHTTNGGTNWTKVTNLATPLPQKICGLAVVNKDIIYGSGAYNGPAIIIKTTNGGATWTSIDMKNYATNLVDCYFINKDSGFVVGGSPNAIFNPNTGTTKIVILFTADGGNSWETRYEGTTTPEWGWKIIFPSPLVGYVSVENFHSASIIKTTDGGITWSFIGVNNTTDLEGIGFVTENMGWIAARKQEKLTTNSGLTWQDVDIGMQLNRFQFFGDTLGYASGVTIYKYTKQSTTGVENEKTLPKSFFLSQNYPNPFNPSTTIRYSIPETQLVTVRIYDGLGKELRTLLHKEQPAGPYSVTWDGKDAEGNIVASGLYIYRIDAGNDAESKMMVLMK